MRTWAIIAFIGACFLSGCKDGGKTPEIIPGTDLGPAPSVSNPNQALPRMDRDPFVYDCVANTLLSKAGLDLCRQVLGDARADK